MQYEQDEESVIIKHVLKPNVHNSKRNYRNHLVFSSLRFVSIKRYKAVLSNVSINIALRRFSLVKLLDLAFPQMNLSLQIFFK